MTLDTAPIGQSGVPGAAGRSTGLGRRAVRGASVVYAGQAARILLQMASVSVLARLLTPSDYGLLAIVLAVVGVGEIFRDFGLSTAAIQARELSPGQRSTLFWLNTAIGAVLTMIVFLGAPLVAQIFGYRQLSGIAHALAFTFLLNGMTAQYRAHLARGLRFGTMTLSDLISQALGIAVAIIAALLGAGYWSLVAQQLSQAGVGLVILAVRSRWLPVRPAPIRTVRPMIHYGWNLAGSQLVGYLNSNVDTLTISLRFGAVPLGLYNRGFQLLMRPVMQMRAPTNDVAVPVLARLQSDTERSNDYVLRGQIVFGYSLVPLLAVVFAASSPIVNLFLGSMWASTAPIVAALAVAGVFETLPYVGSWVYQSRGLTPQLFGYSLMSLGIKIICVVCGSHFGVTGVAIGYAVAPGLAWPLSIWWLGRLTVIPRKQLLLGAARIMSCGIPAAIAGRLVVMLTSTEASIVQLLVGTAIVSATYVVALAMPQVRRDVRAVLSLGLKAVRR